MKRRLRLCTSDQKPNRGLIFFFKCGENTIEYESSYKYLGFWFNEFLDMSRSIRKITKSASRVLGAVYTKYLHAGGMSYDDHTKLITVH